MSRRRSSTDLLTLDGETLTIAEWSKKTGTCMATLYSRLSGGWPVKLVLTAPPDKGGKIIHKLRPRRKKRKGVQPGQPDWKKIPCPTCNAPRWKKCWDRKKKTYRKHPHGERFELAPVKDDRDLVPEDWKTCLAEVRKEKEEDARLTALGDAARDMLGDGMTTTAAARALEVSFQELGKALGTNTRDCGIKPGSIEFTRKLVARAGQRGIKGSFSPCGGGWRSNYNVLGEDNTLRRAIRLLEDGRQLD